MQKAETVKPKKFSISATTLHNNLGLTGNALEWAATMNVRLGLIHGTDYDVPHSPQNYEVVYSKTAAARIQTFCTGGLPETGFLRLPEVLSLFPVKKTTWWAGIKKGVYPKGIKLSARVTAWRAEDIRALIANIGGGEA